MKASPPIQITAERMEPVIHDGDELVQVRGKMLCTESMIDGLGWIAKVGESTEACPSRAGS